MKQVRQFVDFVGYYRHFIQNFAELLEPLMVLTQKGAVFAWTSVRQEAPILGFATEDDRFVLDTDARLFAVGGVLSRLQGDREVVIAYARRSLRNLYYTSGNVSCYYDVYSLSFLFTRSAFHSAHRSLQWLQRFHNSDGILARCSYMLLGQFSVTVEYR